MKTKIIAFILAILCFSTLLVGCTNCEVHVDENKDKKCDTCGKDVACDTHVDEQNDLVCDVCNLQLIAACDTHKDEDENLVCDVCDAKIPCDPHKDVNADTFCDKCGGAIVIMVEKESPVTDRVPMSVNPVPTDAALSDYLQTVPEYALVKDAKKYGDVLSITTSYRYLVSRETSEDGTLHTYRVIHLPKDETVFEATDAADEGQTKTIAITLGNDFFTVEVNVWTGSVLQAKTVTYYTYAGEKMTATEWKLTDVDSWADIYKAPVTEYQNEVAYVTIDGETFAFDIHTKALLASGTAAQIAKRPAFGKISEKYGYTEYNEIIYVYDRAELVKCVASYTIPSYYVEPRWFVLQNGNVLIQGLIRLSDHAQTYDILENGHKYDILYTLFNVEENSAKNIEFGYYIESLHAISDDLSFGGKAIAKEGAYTDKALNLATVCPIVNDRVDSNDSRDYIVDNELGILFDAGAILTPHDRVSWYTLVGENLFRVAHDYGESLFSYEIVNEKGEHVADIPLTALQKENYVLYDGKVYNYAMEEKYDLEKNGYLLGDATSTYLILAKDGVVYYYNVNMDAPVALDVENVTDLYTYDVGYEIAYTVTEDDVPTTKYAFYNANNELVTELDAPISTAPLKVEDYEGNTVYLLAVGPHKLYVIK